MSYTRRSAFALALCLPLPLSAQRGDRQMSCKTGWRGRDERACEVREISLSGRRDRIEVSGGRNGGISVTGWDRDEVRIRARVEATADTESEAKNALRDIRLLTDGTIRSEGPELRDGVSWGVSFEISVPRRIALDLQTHNGGIALNNLDGVVRFAATNGGVALRQLAGDVRGETTNGGVRITLDGDRWRGAGLDVETRNGGVTVDIPRHYSAELETGTQNGGLHIDFPVTVRGRVSKQITTTLGRGGPRVRVRTTNGGVHIREI